MNKKNLSRFQKLKKFFEEKKNIKSKEKKQAKMDALINEAYALARQENGFQVRYLNIPPNVKCPVSINDFETNYVRRDNYYFAMHSSVWNFLYLKQKLAVLIFVEKEFAERINRRSAEFGLIDLGKDRILPYVLNNKIYNFMDWSIIDKMNTIKTSVKSLTERERAVLIKKYGDGIFDILNKFKDVIIPIERKNSLSAFQAAAKILKLDLRLQIIDKAYRDKNKKFTNIKSINLLKNSEHKIAIKNFNKLYLDYKKHGQGYLTIKEEKQLCSYFCQPFEREYYRNLRLLKVHALLGQERCAGGLGYSDPKWESFYKGIEKERERRECLITYHYKDKDRMEIYEEGFKLQKAEEEEEEEEEKQKKKLTNCICKNVKIKEDLCEVNDSLKNNIEEMKI